MIRRRVLIFGHFQPNEARPGATTLIRLSRLVVFEIRFMTVW